MAKLVVKFMLMVFVMIGMSNYGLYLLTGKTPFANLQWPDFSLNSSDLQQLNPLAGGIDTAYKWTDEKGVTHYSNEEPPKDKVVQTIEVDPNINLIQSVDVEEKKIAEKSINSQPTDSPVLHPKSVKKLIEDAKNVEKVLQERFENQEALLNEL